jgi:hypothetical protein
MNAIFTLSLIAAAALLLFLSVSYLINNRPRAERPGGAVPDEEADKRLLRVRLRTRLAFSCSVLILLAHRAAMTYMLLSMDFRDRNVQEGFGMSWWFLDPVAGFPIIIGTLPLALPMPRLIANYYIPFSLLLYAGIIYGLWLLSRHAFASAKPTVE